MDGNEEDSSSQVIEVYKHGEKCINSCTGDGSVDFYGKPALKARTGGWRSASLLLVNQGLIALAFSGVMYIGLPTQTQMADSVVNPEVLNLDNSFIRKRVSEQVTSSFVDMESKKQKIDESLGVTGSDLCVETANHHKVQIPTVGSQYEKDKRFSPYNFGRMSSIPYVSNTGPAAFRINSSSLFHVDIRSQLENDFARALQAIALEGDEEDAIRPLPWYPENLAWHSNFSRMQLRKNQSLKEFHEFLKLENEIGNITRQEAVSMVPPLFLDVHSNHIVLDMCAVELSNIKPTIINLIPHWKHMPLTQAIDPACLAIT
ncbi:hypothetical protein KIW84_052343 [Lathyrus oleraceus]|uniref:Uncharacterized protein n=1 Tax=Pisum sativum TaxID=3888 RepID=A0A9D5ABT9_PEA|nr:hypothetical protein KIW84_052343 [Pisum sativum]